MDNKERIMLVKLVKEQIRKAQNEKEGIWFHGAGKKPRKKYGLATMVTLYEIERKLTKNLYQEVR